LGIHGAFLWLYCFAECCDWEEWLGLILGLIIDVLVVILAFSVSFPETLALTNLPDFETALLSD